MLNVYASNMIQEKKSSKKSENTFNTQPLESVRSKSCSVRQCKCQATASYLSVGKRQRALIFLVMLIAEATSHGVQAFGGAEAGPTNGGNITTILEQIKARSLTDFTKTTKTTNTTTKPTTNTTAPITTKTPTTTITPSSLEDVTTSYPTKLPTTKRKMLAQRMTIEKNSSSSSMAILNRRAWPLKHYDIWNDANAVNNAEPSLPHERNAADGDARDGIEVESIDDDEEFEFVPNTLENGAERKTSWSPNRHGKVIHFFPIPVDGECLSTDGRRLGTCFNAYECRAKGGASSGECAHGFGVCCIFTAVCNQTVTNNITYIISPEFPSFMPGNVSACSLKVKLLSDDISQLRIDFQHFSLGQPNRRTGVCDGDVFRVSGGPGGAVSLCGQNSGQHLYYDVGGRSLPRQTLYGSVPPITLSQLYPNASRNASEIPTIEISMTFSERFLPMRLWEIRVAQIPFSQRAPAGCLQYHSGTEGVIQTFNYAENGRHLANQNYRICMRQETGMCSIMYQPCDDQSFRIAPNSPFRGGTPEGPPAGGSTGGASPLTSINGGNNGGVAPNNPLNGQPTNTGNMQNPLAPAAAGSPDAVTDAPAMLGASSSSANPMLDALASNTVQMTAAPDASTSVADAVSMASSPADAATSSSQAPSATSPAPASSSPATTTASTASPASSTVSPDEVEGSGDDSGFFSENVSRRPRPVSGGFDLLGFLRHAIDYGLGRGSRRVAPRQRTRRQFTSATQLRQFYSGCMDRVTLPCIVEDFIGTDSSNFNIPDCEPIHCGSTFCSSGEWPCRIESTVTPFYLSVHFGRGTNKGSPEDNIGACLRYNQIRCL